MNRYELVAAVIAVVVLVGAYAIWTPWVRARRAIEQMREQPEVPRPSVWVWGERLDDADWRWN